jgi:hypothetical protein
MDRYRKFLYNKSGAGEKSDQIDATALVAHLKGL